MAARSVVIVGAARTPIGKYGGSFRDLHPAELGAVAATSAIARAGISPADIEDIWIGHGRQAGSGPNPARQVGTRADVPDTTPAQTINKACASSLQAIVSAAQEIALGEIECALAGGVESMSRMPYLIDASDARWGHRMGNFTLVDAMYRDGFTCSVCGLIMGETAEILARQYGITREASDQFALESQHKTEAAMAAGRFAGEIAPVTMKDGKGSETIVDRDEHPRPGTTLEQLKKLPLVFGKMEGQEGIITAGSSSGITDGGAAVIVMAEETARARGLKPLARVTGWASAAVDPRIMGIAPVPAMKKLFARTGARIEDFDLVELNEAFAPQVLAVLKDVPIPAERLNVNGGAIALGHPIGATGTRIVVTLLHEMQRRGARRGLATLCVSGGLGMAVSFEAVQ